MSTQVTSELRAQIIASIKQGCPIDEVAKEHHLTRKTLLRWMRGVGSHMNGSSHELVKARKRITFLERVILDLFLEQKSQTEKGS